MFNKSRDLKDSNTEKSHLINEQIKAKYVILFDEKGEKVGNNIALAEALHRSSTEDLDLVEVGRDPKNVDVAICKIMNYSSWIYHERKKRHKQEVKNRVHETKEMRFRPVTSDHDAQVKLGKVRDFLDNGHKVKIVLSMKGREFANRAAQNEFVEKVKLFFGDSVIFDSEPKSERNGLFFVLRTSQQKHKPKPH